MIKKLYARNTSQRGFTLIEVLVASFITAIILSSAYAGITRAAKSRQHLEAKFDRLQGIQMAVRLVTKDLAQLQPRPVRDLLGQGSLPPIMSGDSDGGIEFTVGGYNNPLNLRRSQQQRVGYEIEGNKLFRVQWPVLDRTQGSVPVRRKILEDVNSISVRYLNPSSDWTESWPPPGNSDARQLPKAVEITIDIEQFGSIRRVVEVAG